MNICIVTVYNSLNSGSFFQAYSLGKFLEKKNINVYYLNVSNPSVSYLHYIYRLLRLFFHGDFKMIKLEKERYNQFKRCHKKLRIIKKKSKEYKEIDTFILGSDTIWNVEDCYFQKMKKTFFGYFFKDKRVISYAPSFANTNYEIIDKDYSIREMLKEIDSISVRDNYSKKIIKNLLKKEVKVVCDPTFLLEKEDYKDFIKKTRKEEYIFLYLFEKLSESYYKELNKFSKENNLKIISGTKIYNSNYSNNYPENFISNIYGAKYVITDTFHGTIFSTIFEKNFVVIDKNKNKVNDFLLQVSLENRKISDNDNDLIKKLNENIQYDSIKNKINMFKNESQNFLLQEIEEKK